MPTAPAQAPVYHPSALSSSNLVCLSDLAVASAADVSAPNYLFSTRSISWRASHSSVLCFATAGDRVYQLHQPAAGLDAWPGP